ncbi:hypothetical protein Mp_2g17790 [Marchantia polymorpha subsp. ruderalis]|uniref:Uncharacterized protein n=1 Tax=Marchantia polymorpha TaxID=3197 RepID=A0A2R6WGA3_MARPO|nr:hypothetical protein MARPO_0094s0047 [Marchantia polymorpha]BBN02747.1 hypothetical protein Mp_2g17790 [Marchantia polymorpha subsp. ruderalis]|eukprot:PTQ32873.1 hypothetical protein MARPO_0094s0047 [Marchantia polymorpha]
MYKIMYLEILVIKGGDPFGSSDGLSQRVFIPIFMRRHKFWDTGDGFRGLCSTRISYPTIHQLDGYLCCSLCSSRRETQLHVL